MSGALKKFALVSAELLHFLFLKGADRAFERIMKRRCRDNLAAEAAHFIPVAEQLSVLMFPGLDGLEKTLLVEF